MGRILRGTVAFKQGHSGLFQHLDMIYDPPDSRDRWGQGGRRGRGDLKFGGNVQEPWLFDV